MRPGVRLAGEAGRVRLDGAFLVGGNDEAKSSPGSITPRPAGRPANWSRGGGRSRARRVSGLHRVREGAQKTDASQQSRNLIIGRRAVIDTKPELEITPTTSSAHGATVGDLDEAALFYLRARGIPPEEARRMLIEGFLQEAVEEIEDSAVRAHLLGRLGRHLGKLEE